MSWIEIIADRKIRDAQDEGLFENLPGKGKPLRLDFDPRIPADQRAAFRMMKEAEFLPDWIQLDKEVRQLQSVLEERLAAFEAAWHAGRAQLQENGARSQKQRRDHERDQFLRKLAEGYVELNRRIDRLNLIVPTLHQQRGRLDLQARMEALEESLPRILPFLRDETPLWHSLVEQKKPAVQLANRMPLRRKRGSFG